MREIVNDLRESGVGNKNSGFHVDTYWKAKNPANLGLVALNALLLGGLRGEVLDLAKVCRLSRSEFSQRALSACDILDLIVSRLW